MPHPVCVFEGACVRVQVVKFVGVQVDVTSRTEGRLDGQAANLPLLLHYDDRWVV
jgi:hypothetical protein